MSLKKILNRFVPDRFRDDIILASKARLAIGAMFVFGMFLVPNTLRAIRIGRPDIAILTLTVSIIMLCCPFILKKSQSITFTSNLFILVFVILITYVTVERGGVTAYYAMNFVLISILAYLIAGLGTGISWGAISITILMSMKVAEINGYPFPMVQSDAAHINITVILIVTSTIGGIFQYSSSGHLKRFAEQTAEADAAADELRAMLKETNRVMSGVAKGDLSRQIDIGATGDLQQLKESVNFAVKMLGESVIQVQKTCEDINRGVQELASAAQSLSAGTTEQAASLEQITSSMNEISNGARDNHENANEAQQLTSDTADGVLKGNSQMSEMQSSMNTISKTSSDVAKVIKVIDEIAFQTNLLALNAAVEAARAGKYGKGFAVVAEEVRALAARSATAARDTTELIQTALGQVEKGVANVDSTAATLEEFVDSMQKISELNAKISKSSGVQSNSVNEINGGLSQVNNVVQRNSSISEQTASSSEELSAQVAMLLNLLGKFKLPSVARPQIAIENQN